ncbi:MAG: hypothetical protein G01um101438_285 [Parcubacteria group bacterium Gr01-1014_38]|nr:MAG: hypothetical protein G01um101438_285 [Parcubacteria group bacterium Gr01-1014_38]
MADLKPPLKGYSLFLEAEGSEQKFLQELVDDLARKNRTFTFPAHVTLLGLLDKTPADLDHVKQAGREIAAGYRGVVTEIVGMGIRRMYFQSVFLPVSPSSELMTMSQQARVLLGHEADPPFMPHWSAVYGDIDERQKRAIVRDLMGVVPFPKVVAIKNIALADVSGYPDEWKILERYPLAD